MNVLKLLLIEDSEDDALMLLRSLKKGGYSPEYIRIWEEKAVRKALKESNWDIIISDYAMPGFTGMAALEIYKEFNLEIPFIIVSGTIGEDVAVETMKNGAHDYLMKGNYDRLVPAIERELKEAEIRKESKITLQALKESEEKFRTIFENIQDVYFETTLDGIIREISPSVYGLLKYKREEILGKSTKEVYHNPNERENLINKILNDKKLIDTEIVLIDKNKELRYCSISSRLEKPDGSDTQIMCGTIRDISDRKKAELEIIKAKELAEESDRIKSSFLATMSHEIRTPLNAVIGFSSLIKETRSPEKIKSFATTINKSGYHLLSIIEDIFDLSILESEIIESVFEEYQLKEIIDDINQMMVAEIDLVEKNHIKLVFKPDTNYLTDKIITNSHRFKQILLNLLKNAVKFTEKGSIEYGYKIINKEFQFYVKDTGIGISKKFQKIIFERFRQADDTHTREFGGAGLGLAISKRLVEIFGGKIWLESEPGKGSIFYFTIPIQELEKNKPQKEKTEVSDNKSFDWSGRTILIVEDEETNYRFIQIILESSKANVLWARNGSECLNICTNNLDVELILMDIQLPEMSGLELTKKVKAFRKEIKVIAQTAYALEGDEDKALESGCDDYITKPIDRLILLDKINKLLLNNTSN